MKRILKRLVKPAVLKKIVVAGTVEPRRRVVLEGPGRVFSVACPKDPGDALKKMGPVWDGEFSRVISPDHEVLIKINLNTQDPYPASTAPDMVAALVDFLHERKISRIRVGDCCATFALPTRKVARETGVLDALADRAEMVFFDEGEWVRVPIEGRYLKEVTVPKTAMEADRIISLANMKTHRLADFSFGLKLSVGFMHPLERGAMHQSNLREKAVEINLAVGPDLTIIDGRKAFVSGGPMTGRVEECGAILFGADPLATDVETFRLLCRVKDAHDCREGFCDDPFEMAQFRHAQQIDLFGRGRMGHEFVEL